MDLDSGAVVDDVVAVLAELNGCPGQYLAGIVEARATDAQGINQFLHRRTVIAFKPEQFYCFGQYFTFVKVFSPRHNKRSLTS